MQAWLNDNGIRLRGLMDFQMRSPKGTLEGILDKLKAQAQRNGKRIVLLSADDAVIYHGISTADSVKVLQDSGVETHTVQSPITEKLREHLGRCEKAVQSTKPILAKHGYPDDERTVIVIGFISIGIEHHEAFLCLVMREMIGSAFALGRPIVEGAYRGLWLNAVATDAELKKFIEDDKIDPTFQELAEALDPAHNSGDLFQELKKNAWKALNSYTHTGMLQVGRRFAKHEVENSYSEGEIYEFSTTLTTCVLMLVSRFLAKQNHPDAAKAVDALVETYGPVADAKRVEAPGDARAV
jgi:hypothetical protein